MHKDHVKSKENGLKINITPYGKNSYWLTWLAVEEFKIWKVHIFYAELLNVSVNNGNIEWRCSCLMQYYVIDMNNK